MRDLGPPSDPLIPAFDALSKEDVEQALRLIDRNGVAWLRARTGCDGPVPRVLHVQGRDYPLKAAGYLAAQLSAGITQTTGQPVTVDRVIRALCRCGFDVT